MEANFAGWRENTKGQFEKSHDICGVRNSALCHCVINSVEVQIELNIELTRTVLILWKGFDSVPIEITFLVGGYHGSWSSV